MASNVPTSDDNNVDNQVEHIEDESATSDDNNVENQVEFIHQWTRSSDKDKQVVIGCAHARSRW